MDPKLFQQAIDRMFPKLDDGLRKEIHDRVSGHIFEVLKDKVFENDSIELQKFQQAVKDEQDDKKQAELYAKTIFEKLVSLPKERQKQIDQEIAVELDTVMKDIYKIYE